MTDNIDLPPELIDRSNEIATLPDDPIDTIDNGDGNRRNQAAQIVQLAERQCSFFIDDHQNAYADVMFGKVRKTFSVSSDAFAGWLMNRYYNDTDSSTVPSAESIRSARRLLENRAQEAANKLPVGNRVMKYRGAIYLDMCDDRWRAIKVTPDGWEIVDQPDVRFIRGPEALPLPEPDRDGKLADIQKVLKLESREDYLSVAIWLLGCLTNGPYANLCITGPEGASKTSSTRICRNVIDPSSQDISTPPANNDDLLLNCTDSFVQAIDNVSRINKSMSDYLCRLATGTTFKRRKLYTDGSIFSFTVKRPLILNGIGDLITQADLASRAIPLRLSIINDDERMTEEQVTATFDALHPSILGGLLNAAVIGLQSVDTLTPRSLPRMADLGNWTLACAAGFAGDERVSASDEIEALFKGWAITNANEAILGDHFSRLLCTVLETNMPFKWDADAKAWAARNGPKKPTYGEATLENERLVWKVPMGKLYLLLENARNLDINTERGNFPGGERWVYGFITQKAASFSRLGITFRRKPRGGGSDCEITMRNGWSEEAVIGF